MFFVASDGRDDLDISQNGERDINEDETRFLRAVENSGGNMTKLVENIHAIGKVTDDLSIIRISFEKKEENTEKELSLVDSAKTLIQAGLISEGIVKLLECLKSNPHDIAALEILSNLHYDNGNYKEASYYFEKILDISPNDMDIIFNLSICYKHTKDYDLSIKFAERLFELNPKKISNVINLADNYRIKGDYIKSRNALNLVIDSISHFENAIKLDRILKTKGY